MPRESRQTHAAWPADDPAWGSIVRAILCRHPAVGMAVGVVCDGQVEFVCHGHADLESGTQVAPDTVFRVGSITKTLTAVAILQLWERGSVNLDAPAADYLTAFRLVPREADFHPPSIRQLLTHTAGIPDARHLGDLLHLTWGPWDARPPVHSVPFGARLPSLAEHYRRGLEVSVEPGSAFSYSNPGFATLGQIVEDVSGVPLDRYLREHIFEPLGMTDSDLVRSAKIASRLAKGYACGRAGPRRVPDRDWMGAGGGGVYSTIRDLTRYAEALLGGGANAHGRVLRPETLATMFDRQYSTAPGLPAMGLAFFRTDVGGHRVVSHDGILPGFNAHLALAPDDGVAVIGLTNGSSGAMRWLPAEMERLLRFLLQIPNERDRPDVPGHPELWGEMSGRYVLPPRIGDLRGRLAMGGGLEVFVHDAQPMLRVRIPIPGLWRGLPLEPDDADDPYAYRVNLSRYGMGPVRLRFRRDPGTGRRLIHSDLGGQPISFVERHPSAERPGSIDRLGAEDQLMLAASRAWAQDIGAIVMLDGPGLFDRDRFRMEAVRAAVAARLHLVPRLRQVIRTPRRGRGAPYWTDAPAFDLSRHLREVRLEPPAGEAAMVHAVEELGGRRFEKHHPLWRIWFLTGLGDGKVAMLVQIHHTVGDGLAAMTIVSAFMDPAPDVVHPAPPTWTPRRAPSPSELVADNLGRRVRHWLRVAAAIPQLPALLPKVRAFFPATKELVAATPADRTALDRVVGPARRVALVRTSYRTLRRIGRRYDASVNDVLLAVTAAGLRRLFLSRGQPVAGVSLRAYVPVTLRRRLRGPQHGTHIAQMSVLLSLEDGSAATRVRRISAATRVQKALPRLALGSLFRGKLVTGLLLKLVIAQRVNVATASIPAARRPVYFAGAQVREVFPVLPLMGNQPVGVGAVSYADSFGIGITVDSDVVPDVQVLAAGMRDELEALTHDTGHSGSSSRRPGGSSCRE